MKKLLGLIMLFIFILPATLFAYGRGGGGEDQMSILTALDLSNEQQEEMKGLMAEHHKEMAAFQEKIKNKQNEVNEELLKENTDPERLKLLNNELAEVQLSINQEKSANCLETKKIIGSEKLKELFEQRAKKGEGSERGQRKSGRRQGRGRPSAW
jgi:anion-transporting  ArsA/GET3 family ATPase